MVVIMSQQEYAELKIGQEVFQLPIKKSILGPNVIDIKNLYKESNFFTYDPGFMSTASCASDITYIDGKNGILLHRGYDISTLAENFTFLEVAYLLLKKKLPSKEEYKNFKNEIFSYCTIGPEKIKILKNLPQNSHPMFLLLTMFSSLQLSHNIKEDDAIDSHIMYVIAQMLVISALIYKYSTNQSIETLQYSKEYDFAENLLQMFFSNKSKLYKDEQNIFSDAMNKVLILHIDHEQNASTSSVRMVGSSLSSIFSAISAGIASLSGILHGGANEKVLHMIEQIKNVQNIDHFIKRAKDPKDNFRLMGFGHRVYKNYDPRAKILKKILKPIIENLNSNNRKLQIAQKLESIALQDQYFIDKKLYPNVDFYSGIIYEAIGIPTSMFTVMFAIARSVGWLAHWKEMREDPEFKLARPRQLYLGLTQFA